MAMTILQTCSTQQIVYVLTFLDLVIISGNTHLTHLQFVLANSGLNVTEREFFDGLKRNSSIHKLDINFGDQLSNQLVTVEEGGVGHEIFKAYQESNRHLSRLYIRFAQSTKWRR